MRADFIVVLACSRPIRPGQGKSVIQGAVEIEDATKIVPLIAVGLAEHFRFDQIENNLAHVVRSKNAPEAKYHSGHQTEFLASQVARAPQEFRTAYVVLLDIGLRGRLLFRFGKSTQHLLV